MDGEARILVNSSSSVTAVVDDDVLLHVNRVPLVRVDQTATNGVVHRLGRGVLVPDLLQIAYSSAGLFRTVEQIENDEGLMDVLSSSGPFTLFGPEDSAYLDDASSSTVAPLNLSYHVAWGHMTLPSYESVAVNTLFGAPAFVSNFSLSISHPYIASQSGIYINHAEILPQMFRSLNGIIFAVDSVLIPPKGTVMDILYEDDQSQKFASLLSRAGLDLSQGTWTVFAPGSSVIEQVYLGESIWSDSSQLLQLLSFHLVKDQHIFTPYFANASCQGVNPNELYCDGPNLLSAHPQGNQCLSSQVASKHEIFLSTVHEAFSASFIKSNILANNGVVHIIDGFLTYYGYNRPRR